MSKEAKKTCNKCLVEKNMADFYRQKVSKDGYLSHCKSCRNATISLWQQKNRDFVLETVKANAKNWYLKNKERKQEYVSCYAKNNKAIVNARSAKRRAAEIKLTPVWADKQEIAMWYEVAEVLSRSGVKFHVDHIAPLQGKNVSGFHSQHNLQVITASQNIAKGNRHE